MQLKLKHKGIQPKATALMGPTRHQVPLREGLVAAGLEAEVVPHLREEPLLQARPHNPGSWRRHHEHRRNPQTDAVTRYGIT